MDTNTIDLYRDLELSPTGYLLRNQPSDPAVVDRIKKAAQDKIERRKLRRVQLSKRNV